MTAITADRVRKLCRAIRTRTDSYSGDIRHWLLDLHKMEETGWSPDALPMIQLAARPQWRCAAYPGRGHRNHTIWVNPTTGENEMKVSEAYPSDFLKAVDIGNNQVRVLISHVEMRDLGDDEKPVVFFQNKKKGCRT